MAGMTVVPIKAHLLWNDIQQIWRLKISREEKEAGGNKIWVPFVVEETTLTDAIQQLLLYWAMAPANDAGEEQVRASIGDPADLIAFIGANVLRTVVGPPAMELPEGYVDVDPALTAYDGTDDDWGVTP